MRRVSLVTVLGLGLTTVVAFTVPASGGLAATALGGPVRPVRTPQGQALRNVRNQVTTENWSGYAIAKYETGSNYTSASATWVVPTASTPPGNSTGYSSSWVGIGGFCLNSACSKVDKTLIQLGTEQDASSSGATQYYAWWETLPQGSQRISSVPISPGDTVTASLADAPSMTHAKGGPGGGKGGPGGGGKGQTWTLSLTDTTTGTSWSATLSYKSSLASAEWIEEAPYSGGILPLANFGTATFDPGSANGGSPGLQSSDGIVMSNPNGQTSNISAPDSDFDGFNACWGNGTALTSCSAPAS
ncbi:MAG: G1 family endopeptidase [Actinomycetota bacterium]|nr:G1 family endopeptidase [Actinomycetota bacterium]